MQERKQPHIVIPLYGRFKNESNVARYHVMKNVVCKTKSGIRGALWVLRAIEQKGVLLVKSYVIFELLLLKDSTNKFLFSDATGKWEKKGV